MMSAGGSRSCCGFGESSMAAEQESSGSSAESAEEYLLRAIDVARRQAARVAGIASDGEPGSLVAAAWPSGGSEAGRSRTSTTGSLRASRQPRPARGAGLSRCHLGQRFAARLEELLEPATHVLWIAARVAILRLHPQGIVKRPPYDLEDGFLRRSARLPDCTVRSVAAYRSAVGMS